MHEHRFVGVLYELPSNYAHIKNVALDAACLRYPTRSGCDTMCRLWALRTERTSRRRWCPIGGGRHRLFLNAAVRGAIGKGAGDSGGDPDPTRPQRPDARDTVRIFERLWPRMALRPHGRHLRHRDARNS